MGTHGVRPLPVREAQGEAVSTSSCGRCRHSANPSDVIFGNKEIEEKTESGAFSGKGKDAPPSASQEVKSFGQLSRLRS